MDQRGNIHDLEAMNDLLEDAFDSPQAKAAMAKLEAAMQGIPEGDEARVGKMNRKARRAWFAAQRRSRN